MTPRRSSCCGDENISVSRFRCTRTTSHSHSTRSLGRSRGRGARIGIMAFAIVCFSVALVTLTAAPAWGQVGGAAVKAGFGVDADVRADTTEQGTGAGLNTDDWYPTDSIAPAVPGTGTFVIDTTGGGAFRAIISTAGSTIGRNLTFVAGMNPALGLPSIDAVYARDHTSSAGATDTTVFDAGSNKNADNLSAWQMGPGGAPQKNDIIDAAAHLRRVSDSLWLFAYVTTNSADGNSHVDYEFFASNTSYDPVTDILSGLGSDSGHTAWRFDGAGNITQVGDVIMAVDFENGGTAPLTSVRIWVDTADTSAPNPFAFTGISADGNQSGPFEYAEITVPSGAANAVVNIADGLGGNGSTLASPWGSLEGSGSDFEDSILTLQMSEIGLNLTAIGLQGSGGGNPCSIPLGNIFFKSRSAASFTSELKDFVGPYQFGIFREKPQCAITGPDAACPGETGLSICVPSTSGASYAWSVVGGTLTSGQGTTCITFDADNTCSGFVDVTVIVTSSDGCPDTCDTSVPIIDSGPPTITCPPDATIDCGASTAPANTGTATATDDCAGSVTITYSDAVAAGCVGATGGITRTWVATDGCGNADSCDQIITIEDNTAPTLSGCPADASVDCGSVPAAATVTATDNCDPSPTVAYSEISAAGACAGSYTLTRKWVATDACGNSDSCMQTITVTDTSAPTLTGCPADISLSCDAAIPAPASVTASDDCGSATVTYTQDSTAGGCANDYTLTRTWVATDDCGNANSCVQTITVSDNTAPTLVGCPADASADCGSVPAAAAVTATDNCDASPTVVLTESTVAGACAGSYTLTRKWVATDACGNSDSCMQTITVTDTSAPTLSGCPADISLSCDAAIPAPASVTASDDCGSATVTYTQDSTAGGCANDYTLTRTWVATDDCGNANSCVQTITVSDNTAPTLVGCPADASADCGSVPAAAAVTATDNCDASPTVVLTESTVAGACAGSYTLTRKWVATDACGNSDSCMQTITVTDTSAPTLSGCPADISLSCDAAIPAPASVTASDDCGSATVTYTQDSTAGGCANDYTLTRTWVATDDCGNANSCVQTITVTDTQGPTIACPADVTIECDASTAPANTGTATATDNCGAATISHSDVVDLSGCGGYTGTITRTWTATDDCGNPSSCDQIITIVDTQAPTLVGCPADASADCGSVPAAAAVTATDICDAAPTVALTESSTPGACASSYTLTRKWVATDACGNSDSCTQTITVTDTSAPTLTGCPADLSLSCDDAVPAAANVTASDDCGSATVAYTQDSTAGGCANDYTLTRKWVATDDCGNADSCMQTITVADTEAPTCSVPNDTTIDQCNPAQVCLPVSATDNCDADVACTVTSGPGIISGGNWCYTPVGSETVVVTVTCTDDCDNSCSGTFSVTFDINQAPVCEITGGQSPPICSPPTHLITFSSSDPDGDPLTCTNTNPGATLGAGVWSYNPVPGEHVVDTIICTDPCGAACTLYIDITFPDPAPPICEVPDDQTIFQCDPTEVCLPVFATGGTCVITSGPGVLNGSNWCYTPVGSETVVVSVECVSICDTCTATFAITFDLGTPPVIICPPAAGYQCAADVPACDPSTATVSGGTAPVTVICSSSDNAGSGCAADPLIVTHTYIATDACGKADTCDQIITVIDDTAPAITCPADLTIECDDDSSPANTGSATATDNCGGAVTIAFSDAVDLSGCGGYTGTITRTWTATDDCGNEASCDQILTIVDTQAPTITCPDDITVECEADVPEPANVTATDNCDPSPTVSVHDGPLSGGSCGGTITRIYVATDACGNADSCAQVITIDDTTPPEITCPTFAVVQFSCLDQVPACDANAAGATDNCDQSVDLRCERSDNGGSGCANDPLIFTDLYIATDDCGNEDTCSTQFTVIDDIAPVLVGCPADAEIECGDPVPPAASVTATDNCGSPQVSMTETPDLSGCGNTGTVTRQWIATDDCGNADTCAQVFTIVDTTDPVLSGCPADVSIECGDPLPQAAAVTATDNCGTPQVAMTETPNLSGCGNTGTVTRQWIVTDDCGNSDTCSQVITIVDTTDPILSGCPADVSIECGAALPNPANVTATDACGNATVSMTETPSLSGCGGTGTVVRVWTATDDCGNTASCSQTITVVDNTPPELVCPPDWELDYLDPVPPPASQSGGFHCAGRWD